MARQDMGAAASIERFFQFSLLGLVSTGFLALTCSGALDKATALGLGAGLLLRGLVVAGAVRGEFSQRAATRAALVYAGFAVLDYFWLSRTLLGATVHLAAFLAVVKILTARSNRDHLYVAGIAFLEVLTAAIVLVDAGFFLFLALDLVFAIAALASAEIRRSTTGARVAVRARLKGFYPRLTVLVLATAAGILVLTACLFFLLPRTADAARSRFAHRLHFPGYSGSVTLGEIGEIKISSRPVMHIRVFSAEQLGPVKWRGSALTLFDGKHWSNPPLPEQVIARGRVHVPLAAPAERVEGRHISYDVELDALDTDTLFFAGVPQAVDIRGGALVRDPSGGLRQKARSQEGFQYEAYSLLPDRPEESPPGSAASLAGQEQARDLQLPRALDARIPALARAWTAEASDDLERARALERRLPAEYGYTLDLPKHEPADPLADFLFTRRRGHCEYFASAMTVMLRTLGIPARLATGFQSGIYNPITGLWLIRASDAHSWVEAWIPRYGWTTFDPTPPDPGLDSLGLAARVGLYLDAADMFWKEWVVSYDPIHQMVLAGRVENSALRTGVGWFDSIFRAGSHWDVSLAANLRRSGPRAGMVLAIGLWMWFAARPLIRLLRKRRRISLARRGQAGMADATVLYRRMLEVVHRHGYERPSWLTPAEFAASLPRGALSRSVGEFTAYYNALRFGGSNQAVPRLSSLLDEISQQAAPRRGSSR